MPCCRLLTTTAPFHPAAMLLALYIFITAQLAWAAPPCDSEVASPTGYPTTTSTGAAPSCPLNTQTGYSRSIVSASWYASWHSSDFTLQDVSWDKYSTHIYAFA